MHKKPSARPATEQLKATRPGGRSARVVEAVLAAARTELITRGYCAFSVADVARAAGVQKTSIYRRWGTPQRLVLDVVLDIARETIPVPNTNDLTTDLVQLMQSAHKILRTPIGRASAAVLFQSERDVAALQRSYWKHRFVNFGIIFQRAIERGQWCSSGDAELVARILLGTVWFRLFISGEGITRGYLQKLVEAALRGASTTSKRLKKP